MYGGGSGKGRFYANRSPMIPPPQQPTITYHQGPSDSTIASSSAGYDLASSAGYPQGNSYHHRQPKPLQTFRKNFYDESPSVRNMTAEEVEQLRKSMEITVVKGPRDLKPVPSFKDVSFPADIEDKLFSVGFKSPSPIQAQAWPILLSGYNFIGIAETGSGKTLAFLLPAVVHILDQPPVKRGEGPIALVMAPTRELVEQIKVETTRFASRLRSGVAYGGASRKGQLRSIRDGLDILVACPGRLIDFMERGDIYLSRVTYLVLDEADRMLDMGFEPQIRTIVRSVRDDRQTVMFSATWPTEVQTLARDLCREDPVHVSIGTTDLKANHNVRQIVTVVSNENEKHQKVVELLKQLTAANPSQRILIFTETKRGCDVLTCNLRDSLGLNTVCIHGDKEQRERNYVLDEFRSGRHPIMVATDVASRGLDIKDVRVVINYDMTHQIEDYVHRIGRTGRAGATGTAYTFITEDKGRLSNDLVRVMLEAKQPIPTELNDLAFRSRKNTSNQPDRRYGGAYRSRTYGGGPHGRGGFGGSRYYNNQGNPYANSFSNAHTNGYNTGATAGMGYVGNSSYQR